ncbi:hotdog domain-containing protein [Anaeromyxobacter dehalogenans]|uniref:Thioesterase superfamily n=1 Tax=Anaeromyxobacter dehalogenans (strain 2CP-C) TaxID=290397 RepID=Q2IDR1_ANADE|nr:acyl-CoA thioesterase [Anaeromyxobacter dehalogenans]ABC82722.1 Thioesterase superfamily [Anaeromyxobacter dehalogenans 2CP-C]
MRPTDTTCEHVLPLSTDPALRRRFMVLKDPIPGNFRFGVLLEVLDRLAADTAMAYAQRFQPEARVVTAALDEIVVRRVADVTRDVRCLARINHVGRTSMEVGIRVESAPDRAHLASCYFTMVARDGDGPGARSVAIPPLELGDDVERVRAARAAARRAAYRREQDSLVEPPSRDEFLLLSALHREQEEPGFAGVRARDVVTETWERTYPEQENLSAVIFGGYIMRRAYELASICAERVALDRPVMAAVNRVNFFHPVQIGDKLHLTSRVVYTDGAMVCIETGIERISRDRSARALSNSCRFTFVNIDRGLRPVPVPTLHPSDYAEDARYLAARRDLRGLEERSAKGWLLSYLAGAQRD